MNAVNDILLCKDVYLSITESFTSREKEAGGILGQKGTIISDFEFDKGQNSCPLKYVPDVSRLNKCLAAWNDAGISFCGMIHTHINGYHKLTNSDIDYGRKILAAFPDMETIVLALYCDDTLRFFLLKNSGDPVEVPYRLI